MPDNTLIGRGRQAYADGATTSSIVDRDGIRATLEHIAAELTYLGHHDAARCLLSQLSAEVIPLRPDRGGAA